MDKHLNHARKIKFASISHEFYVCKQYFLLKRYFLIALAFRSHVKPMSQTLLQALEGCDLGRRDKSDIPKRWLFLRYAGGSRRSFWTF